MLGQGDRSGTFRILQGKKHCEGERIFPMREGVRPCHEGAGGKMAEMWVQKESGPMGGLPRRKQGNKDTDLERVTRLYSCQTVGWWYGDCCPSQSYCNRQKAYSITWGRGRMEIIATRQYRQLMASWWQSPDVFIHLSVQATCFMESTGFSSGTVRSGLYR